MDRGIAAFAVMRVIWPIYSPKSIISEHSNSLKGSRRIVSLETVENLISLCKYQTNFPNF